MNPKNTEEKSKNKLIPIICPQCKTIPKISTKGTPPKEVIIICPCGEKTKLISDYLMEKFDIRIAISQCDYKKAKERVLKAVRYVLKEDKIQQVGLLMENNEAYTFYGCNYIAGKSTIKDRLNLYKMLLENAKKDNYEYAITQRAALGANFKVDTIINNTVKITKKFVKIN